MYQKERKYAEWVRSLVPISGKAAAYEDTLPDNENCSNGIVPQPNAMADDKKMTVPVVVSMTKFLFDHYRLNMYSYLNNSLRSGRLKNIVGFSFTNRTINRDICTFRSVSYWRIDRLNFWADVRISLRLNTTDGIRVWSGHLRNR